ncbi:RHS repeat-associated core domain-containing protein [Arthrobacter crystallopoietes]|uniref:RHS repeat-associated core domain-containing protein n=1 Tax=Micrococcaceae TaxID=1268 RepID=UPI0021C9230F|nr:RHS repeat-associated core domain-containing protein [Arthrobacter sp. Marseille-P9274]
MGEPPGTLAPAVTEPLNPGTTESLALSGDDLPPAAGPDGILAGNRKAAQMVSRDLTDTVKLGWNPATGNTVLTGKLLHLEGADRDIDLSWRYNSINDHRPTLSEGTHETALTVGADDSVTYTAADGGTYKFVPKTGGGWTMPAGLNASITAFSATAVTLRFNDSGETNFYQNVNGTFRLTHTGHHYIATADRNVYAYDAYDRLSSITTPNGRQVTYEYQDSGNEESPSKITDQTLGRTILIDYDSDGRIRSLIDADGKETLFTFTNGKLTSLTDARGTRTDLSYGSDGKAAEIDYGANTTARTVHTLTPVNATTSHLTDGDNRTTVFTFNAARQVTQVTDPLGHTSKKTYNNHDDVLTDLDALGNLTTSTYNPNNTLKNVTSPAGATGGTGKQVSYTYPAATAGEAWLEYQPLTAVDSENNTTSFTYDSVTQRPYQTLTPFGQGGTLVNRYQGDAAGTSCGALRGQLCKTIDGKGNTTSITYDATRNPVTITRPSPLGAVTNTFDAAGRIATSKDGKNQTAVYAYDGIDRLEQIRYSATCALADCVTYTYDANGNLTDRTDAAGTTTVAYDAQNRPTSKAVDGVTTSATYDQASNITSYTDPTGTVDYRYDDDDRLIALAEPDGSCPATPVFPNDTKCTGFTYDNNDRRTATRYPNGVKNTTVYDKAARITSITATNTAGTVLAKRAYTYTTHATTARDGALRKTMTDETGAVTTYGYDKMARLTSAAVGTVTDSWTYDANGNRLTASKTGAATVHYAYNAADQLCWTGSTAGTCTAPPAGAALYTYDANGNNTKSGTPTSIWNTFNQMTSHTRSTTALPFTYAGPSNTERTSAGTTTFVNGLLGLTRQTSGTTTTSFVRDPQGTLISMTNSAGTFYYTADALKSTIALTDSTQTKVATYTYDSWGRTTGTGTQAGTNRFQYLGEYKDAATALNKFGARYYDATTGRFTQPDPSGQEANRYAYAECNPVNVSDPSGLQSSYCTALGMASIGVGAVSLASGVGALFATGTILGAPAGLALGLLSAGTAAISLTYAVMQKLSC